MSAHEGPWMNFIIHPQTGGICQFSSVSHFWPVPGESKPYQPQHAPRIWPTPRLIGARLAECGSCGRTGIVPRTVADAVRYIPGAVLGENGSVTLSRDSFSLPDGKTSLDDDTAGADGQKPYNAAELLSSLEMP
jgi:hypothetical protein